MTYMTVFSTTKLNGIFYLELTILSIDHTCVTFLSTHGSIEWCLCCKYSSLLTFYQRIYQFCLRSKYRNLGFVFQSSVSGKLCSDRYIDLIVYSSICSHVIGHFTAFTGTFSLCIHLSLETGFINLISFFFQNLFGQIHWESISIIQLECICASKCLFSLSFQIFFQIIQNTESLVNGLIKLIFFIVQNIEDEFFLFFQFRISISGTFNDCCT